MSTDRARSIKTDIAIARALLDEVERSLDAGVTMQLVDELRRVAANIATQAPPDSEVRLRKSA